MNAPIATQISQMPRLSNLRREKKIDIIYEIQATTFTSETKKCPECGERNKEEFPEGIDGKIQYGNGIKAAIINFLTIQMMSLKRVQEHFTGDTVLQFIHPSRGMEAIEDIGIPAQIWWNYCP